MENHSVQTRQEVDRFLKTFFPKMQVFGIFFVDRDKNAEAMKMLGISAAARIKIIKDIMVEDYVETVRDLTSYGDMFVFGKDYDGSDIYVKISLGKPNNTTICVSFHVAEHPITYPYK